jgi:hypothetical protein
MSARWAHSPGSPHSTCTTAVGSDGCRPAGHTHWAHHTQPWGTGLTDVGPLGTLTGLTTLSLYNCKGLTDVGPLGTLTGLTTLNLNCGDGSDGCRPAGHTHRAHHTHLAGTGLTDVGPLGTLTGLTTLNLNSCEGSDGCRPAGHTHRAHHTRPVLLQGSDGCRPAGHTHRAHHTRPCGNVV